MTNATSIRKAASPNASFVVPEPTWFSAAFYDFTYWLSGLGMMLGFSYRSSGLQHVPREGPALFVANHQSFLDPVIVGLAVRRHLSYLARKSLFRQPMFTWLIRMLNAVPIDQEGLGIDGLRTVLKLLQAGRAVLVFPEGERTGDGNMQALQPGVQLLVKRTLAPVIPIGIAGAYDAWPRWRRYPVPAPLFLPAQQNSIAVVVGKPLSAQRLAKLPRTEMLERLDHEMHTVWHQAEHLRRQPEERGERTSSSGALGRYR